MAERWTWQPRARRGAAVAAVLALATLASTVSGGAIDAASGDRPATGELPATVLAALAVVRPYGMAIADDGTIYIAGPSAKLVRRIDPDGSRTVLPLALEAPAGLALGPDGTLFIADGSRVSTMDASGRQGGVELPGATAIDAVGVDGTGAVYATDPVAHKVFRIDIDGLVSELAFTGVTEPHGIDVADDGTVSIIDGTTRNVVRRAADGTQTSVAFTGLRGPLFLDVEGDRVAVSDSGDGVHPASVVLREADGTEASVLDVATPGQVVLQSDGTVIATDAGVTGCRCPEPPGRVVRVAPGGEQTSVDLGDLVEVGPLAADGPSGVLFTSWPGARGYTDPNPLRRVVGTRPAEDVAIPDGQVIGVDVASDGTAYLTVVPDGTDKPVRLLRRSADGATLHEVPLPHDAATPNLVGVSVDQDGRLFVAMSTGYGNGAFEIVEPLAAGGPKVRYRTADDAQVALQEMAAGAGKVFVVVSILGSLGTTTLQAIEDDGSLADVRTLPAGAFNGMDVDAAGNVYLAATSGVRASGTAISVIAADGTTGTITYANMGYPQALSVGTDGTLYVADNALGIVSIADVGALAADDDGSATPAVPVPGQAGFTG